MDQLQEWVIVTHVLQTLLDKVTLEVPLAQTCKLAARSQRYQACQNGGGKVEWSGFSLHMYMCLFLLQTCASQHHNQCKLCAVAVFTHSWPASFQLHRQHWGPLSLMQLASQWASASPTPSNGGLANIGFQNGRVGLWGLELELHFFVCLISSIIIEACPGSSPGRDYGNPMGSHPMVCGKPWAAAIFCVPHGLLGPQHWCPQAQEQCLDGVLGSTSFTAGVWQNGCDAWWVGVAAHGIFGCYHLCLHVKTCVCCLVHLVFGSCVEYESCLGYGDLPKNFMHGATPKKSPKSWKPLETHRNYGENIIGLPSWKSFLFVDSFLGLLYYRLLQCF